MAPLSSLPLDNNCLMCIMLFGYYSSTTLDGKQSLQITCNIGVISRTALSSSSSTATWAVPLLRQCRFRWMFAKSLLATYKNRAFFDCFSTLPNRQIRSRSQTSDGPFAQTSIAVTKDKHILAVMEIHCEHSHKTGN